MQDVLKELNCVVANDWYSMEGAMYLDNLVPFLK